MEHRVSLYVVALTPWQGFQMELVGELEEEFPHPCKVIPHLCSVKKANKLIRSPERASVDFCLSLFWDPRTRGCNVAYISPWK